jgi:hypothetical protein
MAKDCSLSPCHVERGPVETGPEHAGRILLENHYFPSDFEAKIAVFVQRYNHRRYHESLNNLTPADVYHGRRSKILRERERIKRITIQNRRLQHQMTAA